MKRVKQHQIDLASPFYQEVDDFCFASKNLYNTTQYNIRQSYFMGWGVPSQSALDKLLKGCSETKHLYYGMPTKVSQLVIKQATDSWESYFKALNAYKEDPSKFTGKPKEPGYLDKDGRNLVKFNDQAVSKKALRKGLISPSGMSILLPSLGVNEHNICEVRLIPKTGCHVLEIVYEDGAAPFVSQPAERVASIDLGLDVLAMLTFNQPDIQPIAYNGKPLKSMNQWWNKEMARLRSLLPDGQRTSKRIQAITRKRNNQVDYYLHSTSSRIVADLKANQIDTLVIGKNKGWKQRVNLGRKNNQKFVQIPYNKLIHLITYKAEAEGISVIVGEESYTSKASFIDWDNIPTYGETTDKPAFSGRRIKRAWYKTAKGTRIHADANGSFNIGRKVIPSAYEALAHIVRDRGCRAFQDFLKVVVHPRRVTPVPLASRRNQGSSGKSVQLVTAPTQYGYEQLCLCLSI